MAKACLNNIWRHFHNSGSHQNLSSNFEQTETLTKEIDEAFNGLVRPFPHITCTRESQLETLFLRLDLKNVFKGIFMWDEIENLQVESTPIAYIFSTKPRERSPEDKIGHIVCLYWQHKNYYDCKSEYSFPSFPSFHNKTLETLFIFK